MFLIPTAAFRFIKEGRYSRKQALTCNTIGLIGTFSAFFLVTNIPIYWLKWLITIVLLYTAYTMLRDAIKMRKLTGEDSVGQCCCPEPEAAEKEV